MNNQEIYAVVEIGSINIKFMVFDYQNSNLNVLFNSLEEHQYYDQGVVTNPKAVGKIINNMIQEANYQLAINIKRVALNLPTDYLQIKQTQAVLEIGQYSRAINQQDINNLLQMSKNVKLEDDEVICLTRPYKYILDNQRKIAQPPIGVGAKTLAVNALIYTINESLYLSHLESLKYAKCELLSIVLTPFALAWSAASRKQLHDGVVIVDWGYDTTKISVFVQETLYDLKVIKYGSKHIMQDLQYLMQANEYVAKQYLTKLININSNFGDDKIIYSKYDHESKKYIEFSHQTLKRIVCSRVAETLSVMEDLITDMTKNIALPIICTGDINEISGLTNFIKATTKLANLTFYIPNIIGANSSIWASLLGNAYYQHLLNKTMLVKIYSIDKIVNEQLQFNQSSNVNWNYAPEYYAK